MSDVSRRLEKADKLIQKGKLDSALEELLAALTEDPKNDGIRQSAADLCATLNRDSDAARLLSELFDHQAQGNDHSKALVTYKKLARHGRPSVSQLCHVLVLRLIRGGVVAGMAPEDELVGAEEGEALGLAPVPAAAAGPEPLGQQVADPKEHEPGDEYDGSSERTVWHPRGWAVSRDDRPGAPSPA